MKKNRKKGRSALIISKKMFASLNLLIALLLVNPINMYSNVPAQHVKNFSISLKNVTLEKALDEIGKQSGYIFSYDESITDFNSRVSVNAKNSSLHELLDSMFEKKGIQYIIKENHVLLIRNEKVLEKEDDDVWTIQGQVFEKSEPPYPLIGVNVFVKNTSNGTVTDQGGYFTIKAKRGDIITFNYVGFKPYEYVVSRAISNLNVSLEEDIEMLDEVVVTGFTMEKKLNTISSISTLNVSSNLLTKPITSLSQALQGGITGLSVTQSSGLPGADAATIKIRGITSLLDISPLVLVDGVPMDMDNLDPNTIESVTVLKDAAAAAIYGARAANGVIIIKTKRGMPGKVSISYNGYVGIQQATYLPKFIDGAGYMEMVNQANRNIGGDPIYSDAAIAKTRSREDLTNYPDTDWVDFLFKNGSIHSHSVSVSGGSSVARFALTANYIQNEGLIPKAKSDRMNIRANTSVSLLDNLTVNMDFNSYRTNRQEPMYRSDSYASTIIGYIYTTAPNTVPRYPLKEDRRDIVYYGNRPEMRNPAALIDRGGRRQVLEDNVSINIAPQWEVLPDLILRGQYSYRVSSGAANNRREAYNFFDYQTGALIDTWGSIRDASKSRSSYYYIGGTAEYLFEKKKHRLFSIVGYNQELTNSEDWDQWALRSVFGKANYTFDRRYLLEGTVRMDGSSRFGKGHKYGYFPSIGAGWNLHEERFMKPVKQLDNLKLRASYGLLGNQDLPLYLYQSLIDAGSGNETVFGNPDITWETVHMLNIGTDIGLFKDINITFDYYDKLTKDMILKPTISYIGGIDASYLNYGELRNRGWELSVNYGKAIRDLSFNIHAGLSQNKNKIESLFGGPYEKEGKIDRVGHPLKSYMVYPTDGLLQESDFTTDAEGNLVPKEGVVIFDGQRPGDIKYLDISGPDGEPDGKITTDDRVVKGDDQPKFNYFSNISFRYRKWDFEVLLQGVTGVNAYYSGPYAFGLDIAGDGQTPLMVQKDYWTPENPNARYPRVAPNSTYGNNNHASDFWYFDASYCRVKYIQLGYTFDQFGLKKLGVSNIRLYVNAQNPFTITKEKLVDPESRGQKSSYPLVKTYSVGMSLNF